MQPTVEGDELSAVAEHGRICALSTRVQRDLQKVTSAHQELFLDRPFDPTLFSSVAMAIAFTAPEYPAEQLRVTARTLLWVFAADWRIDYVARSADDVRTIVAGCLAVADGASPPVHNPLARLLAEIRDELSSASAFAIMRPAWREELERMFAAVVQEWEWKQNLMATPNVVALPTLAEYLGNADNLACSFVNTSHWIYVAGQDCLDHFEELRIAGREVQRVLRLVNDLATHGRDEQWGDLNALMLVKDPAEVSARLAALAQGCRDLIGPLEATCPRQATYMRRQIAFTSAFYQVSDFWGDL